MKRDVDLCRKLLLDLEGHGPDCSLTALRGGLSNEADERVRYHLRLLIDAGLVKEIDRTTSGVPCVRLTHAGHEFLDVARSEERWREAKFLVGERTGGLSLTILKTVLTRWAADLTLHYERPRRRAYRPYYYRVDPPYQVDHYRYEREPVLDEADLRMQRQRPEYRERLEAREGAGYGGYDPANGDWADVAEDVSLPASLI